MDLISTKDAAELLGVHPQTIREFIRQGRLRAFTIPGRGHKVFVERSEVQKLGEPEPVDVGGAPVRKGRRK